MEFAIVLMMLLIVVALGAIKLSDSGVAFPFRRKPQLFTPVEHSFLNLIEQAMGHEFRIVSRVRLNDIVSVRQSANKKTASQALSRASARQLDFVLVDKRDMTPVLAIDLVHNKGQDGYKAQKDWFVTGALDAAGVPHARIKVKSGYSVDEIRECLENKLIPLRRLQQRKASMPTLNPEPPKRPTRPVRSSRPAAA
ncbi:DUF2726 domain-containing protein [Alteromonas sp. KUL49]|uniref:DUF2726 domain-containing protein n=1 Tax=Alteromonas sp. KUL49 TaxID=2480798 RepID=UPI00102F10B0|nr:DUF2726 domain-containing protein [Alteromonas sp. KUL49]TAP38587.1 DUF2726 domain-containing protein [Alteromonas sp. KUL49]GEA12521.1 hypothetical protein KUL49_28960 [Alteromonas sp. KUL49]